jgi:nicotinamide mononucleotide transporter
MVKFLVFIPLNIYGFTVWIRHINPLGNETSKRSLSWTGRLYLLLTAILLTGGYGLFLTFLEGQYPFWDGFTTILATMALILCIMRYSEHWILWMIINAVSVGLWVAPFIDGRGKPLAVLLMWCFYLINSAVMYLRWRRHERLEKEAAQGIPA